MGLEFLYPYFLGPYAENESMLEDFILEFLRDHMYWRRNFHPEDKHLVPTTAPYRHDYLEFKAEMQQELHKLSAELKKAAPFFSPRYIGHMNADLLLPGVIAQMMTILYNPNNVSAESGPATVPRELEVGDQLARMFGYNTDPAIEPCAWGHLTSGGTIANYEGLWNFRAVKFYPIALAEAAKHFGYDFEDVGPGTKKLSEYSKWELLNYSIAETVTLMRQVMKNARENLGKKDMQAFASKIQAEGVERLGLAGFFLKHRDIKSPKVLAPITAHYSWEKALKVLGLGADNLISIKTDDRMRMRRDHLMETLERVIGNENPILAVVGVLSGTEFGSVDPIHEIVNARRMWQQQGIYFGIHVDAAWGGYFMTLFRNKDGSFASQKEVAGEFKYFPGDDVYKAFQAVSEVDSITVDPHKLGYLPYPSGAFISRDMGVVDFISQKASYLYDVKDDRQAKGRNTKLRNLGQYIMEGSKPGSAAAAAYVTHRVLPLDREGFGRIVRETMSSSQYSFDKLHEMAERMKNLVTIRVPFVPDTNLITIAVNPKGNKSLALMNHFGRKIFAHMKINPKKPLQVKEFIGSYTSLQKGKIDERLAGRILGELGIDSKTFTHDVEDITSQSDHIFLLRHTLMSPWLMTEDDHGQNYIDRYLKYLESLIKSEFSPYG